MSENGFDIDGEDFEGRLPAHYSAGAGSLECLKFMSSHGIDLVSVDANGWEPIHQAAAADQVCLLAYLHFLSILNVLTFFFLVYSD